MTAVKLTERVFGIKFDGTNHQEILDLCNGNESNVTQNSTYLEFDYSGGTFELNLYDWVTYVPTNPVSINNPLPDAYIQEFYSPFPASAFGNADVPSLVLNQEATVSVTLSGTFEDTNFNANAFIMGGLSILGAMSVLSTTIISENEVEVVVKNTGVATISTAKLFVAAYK